MALTTAEQRQRGRFERQLLSEGLVIAGVDEVGRGCLAGPVFAGCAILNWRDLRRLPKATRALVRDSKTLSFSQRERMALVLKQICEHWNVASATVEEINSHGIVPATFLAMRRAIASCLPFDVLLVDGKARIADFAGRQETVVHGDNLCYSVAAAAILAKTSRDFHMREQAEIFPQFGFDKHVGYGTKEHLAKIAKYGICTLHRTTFAPIRNHLLAASEARPTPSLDLVYSSRSSSRGEFS